MRLPREILFLLVLLLCAMASVLWYVLDRRARRHAGPPIAHAPAAPTPLSGKAPAPAAGALVEQPVDLAKHDGQTIDFSSGRPVIKQSPEDQAALEAGLRDIAAATKDVTFGPPPKPADSAAPSASKP